MPINIIKTVYNWNGSLTNRAKTSYIVLHHAAAITCTPQQIHQWHLNAGYVGIGYNFIVRKDGSIYTGRPIGASGAHTIGYNSTSVGICAEGNFETENMPEVQKDAIILLVKYVLEIYPGAIIKGHGELDATACPGKNYPLGEIKSKSMEVDDVPAILREVPAWAKDAVEWALEWGIINTKEGTEDFYRNLVINYRIYNKFIAK